MRAPVLAALIPLLSLLSLAACGGAQFDLGSDGGPNPSPDGGPTGDGGPAPDGGSSWSPVCPEHAPAIGSACTAESLTCEYGAYDPDPACVTLLQCQTGRWATQQYFGTCTPGPNPAACAPTFAGVPRGATCSDNGAVCRYAQGDCRCEVPFFGGPIPIFDGGPPPPQWDCDDPPSGCPMPRARIGSACSTEGLVCGYRPCSLEEDCMGGYWQAPPIACAAAAP
jgi:hypothetical protein